MITPDYQHNKTTPYMLKAISLICIAPLLLLVLLLVAGCATIVCGPYDVIHVKTNPSGATVTADGIPRGITPTQFALRRDQRHLIAIDLPGYRHYEIAVTRTLNRWFFGNLIFAGPLGMVVDRENGAIYALDPDTICVNLEPIGAKRRYIDSMMREN